MMKPNSVGLSNPIKTSCSTSTCQALAQYCRASRLRNSLATIRPPASPTRSEMMLRKNSMNTVAVTRGVTSFLMGSVPRARMASICSVTTIDPSSLAMPEEFRPATINPVSTGPSSRTMEVETSWPIRVMEPKRCSVFAVCSARTPPVKNPVSTTIGRDPTPIRSACCTMSPKYSGLRNKFPTACAASKVYSWTARIFCLANSVGEVKSMRFWARPNYNRSGSPQRTLRTKSNALTTGDGDTTGHEISLCPLWLQQLQTSFFSARRSVFHIFIKPAQHLVNELFVRLQGGIPVRFVRQQHQPSGAAVASNGFVEFARLQRRSARIRIFRAVHDEQRYLDFVGVEKRGNFQIDIRRLPHRSPFALETERRKRLVIGAAGRHTRPKQIGMSDQIRGHQSAVAVSGDSNSVGVGNTKPYRFVDRRLSVRHQLLQIGGVGFLRVTDDRERGIVDNRIAPKKQQPVLIQLGESLLRACNLAGSRRIGIVKRIRIQNRGHAGAFFVSRRRI